jgi:SOS-response transcriptional repressor LexA
LFHPKSITNIDAMTEKQKTIYLVIDEYWKKFGYGPTIDDVMSMTGDRGRGNVHRTMKKLVQMGACKKLAHSARSIRPSHVKYKNIA